MKGWMMAGTTAILFAGLVFSEQARSAAAQDARLAPKASKASPDIQAKFEKMKKLAGVWQTGDEDKDGNADVTAIFRVVSGGSAVAEYLMPGTEHEMVTVYHLDNDSIVATHYCSLGNQPRMRAKSGGESNVLNFEFLDGTNMAPTDMHIHSLLLTFKDDDHVVANWKAWADGKPADHAPAFSYTRMKDAEAASKIVSKSIGCCVAESKSDAKSDAAPKK